MHDDSGNRNLCTASVAKRKKDMQDSVYTTQSKARVMTHHSAYRNTSHSIDRLKQVREQVLNWASVDFNLDRQARGISKAFQSSIKTTDP